MTSCRRLIGSGSPLEPEIGFSRAVRVGPFVSVAGTAPIAPDGTTAGPGDVYAQSVRCLDIAEQALREAGATLEDVIRTRVMLVDISRWRDAARAATPSCSASSATSTEPAGRGSCSPTTRG